MDTEARNNTITTHTPPPPMRPPPKLPKNTKSLLLSPISSFPYCQFSRTTSFLFSSFSFNQFTSSSRLFSIFHPFHILFPFVSVSPLAPSRVPLSITRFTFTFFLQPMYLISLIFNLSTHSFIFPFSSPSNHFLLKITSFPYQLCLLQFPLSPTLRISSLIPQTIKTLHLFCKCRTLSED